MNSEQITAFLQAHWEWVTLIMGEEFHACVIEKAEFESIWETHTYDGALK